MKIVLTAVYDEDLKNGTFVVPSNVTSIGYMAFDGCSGLTSIIIPSSVTSIGNWTFNGCSGLTIYCEAESQSSGWGSYWNSSYCPVVWGVKERNYDKKNEWIIASR